MRSTGCKWIVRVFAGLYLLALVILGIGVFGLFGQDKDPLSAVYLMPLGLPWVLWADGAPDMMLPWIAALAPALNLVILIALCKAFSIWRGTE
ncbi:MAG: hypothetical protein WBV78_20535 [Roseobacter sp.]